MTSGRIYNDGTGLNHRDVPIAVANLFRLNNYECDENIQIDGSQIDIVATAKGDPFAPKIYIEVTVSYVDNDKYSKDLTKFVTVRTKNPICVCLSVSLVGFTAAVKERALASNIRTQTYAELLRSFEKFSPYIEKFMGDQSLQKFIEEYEEPFFEDVAGRHKATDWISAWAQDLDSENNWIVILGEYGTGKTALTKRVQGLLLSDYISKENRPLPIRIELRDFTRQFDARTLLHNFLDRNGISHVPIDFVFHLIRSRKVVLILDGYDEMAQFLNVRERRSCLSALADLASEGAKGILTSRPNYFSEEEELHVFEALYQNLQTGGYYLSSGDRDYLDEEKQIDQLLSRYVLDKYERYLRDLDKLQTLSLIRRKLSNDVAGQKVVISILEKVFREERPGFESALSGKPVIITYMLDLVENVKNDLKISPERLTEWSIYKLIVDQLMLRDQQRTPGIFPSKRRACLHRLALKLSQRDTSVAYDEQFQDIIEAEFRSELRALDADEAIIKRNELFQNLRSSSTLTRTENVALSGWTFSHNSLREYLICENYMLSAREGKFVEITTPITAAMRSFVAAMDYNETGIILRNLLISWGQRSEKRGLGLYVTLLWNAISLLAVRQQQSVRKQLPSISGFMALDTIRLKEINFDSSGGGDFKNSVFRGSDLAEVNFKQIDLSESDFSETFLDAIVFNEVNISRCSFQRSWIYECDFSNCNLMGAIFTNLSEDPTIYVLEDGKRTLLSGMEALGYLAFQGAIVDPIDEYYVLKNHPKFGILMKICEKLVEQRNRQELGLVQKGASRKDPSLAQDFLALLIRSGWAAYDRTMVAITPEGRKILPDFVEHKKLPSEIAYFLREI